MTVSVYTLENTLFEGEAEKIIARTPLGEISILDNHLPLISSLVGSELCIVDKENKKNIIKINSGFIEVRPGSEVMILAN